MDSLNISVDQERNFIRVKAVGRLSKQDGENIITQARTKAMEGGFDIFYDMRETRTSISMFEWFNLPRNLEVFKDQKAHLTRVAILISPFDEIDKYKFYETVLANLGFTLKVFLDRAEALQWLNRKITGVRMS